MRRPTKIGSASGPRKPAWISRSRTLPTSLGDTGTFEPTFLIASLMTSNFGLSSSLSRPPVTSARRRSMTEPRLPASRMPTAATSRLANTKARSGRSIVMAYTSMVTILRIQM
jgi:hypothetical protein